LICRFSIEMKDGKYEFGEKFQDAKSSGMLDSNMGRVPVHRHVESGCSSPLRPAEAGTVRSAWRFALEGQRRLSGPLK
tara:strand:+ start:423 stop:656 length:234 start_codon:yes stop_codon:yes gene_type:complete